VIRIKLSDEDPQTPMVPLENQKGVSIRGMKIVVEVAVGMFVPCFINREPSKKCDLLLEYLTYVN
jgi:hypothetical protein